MLWTGRSTIDGEQLAVIVTPDRSRSKQNRKLGDVVQIWILREDIDPLTAIQTGADVSICGDCKLRGSNGSGRACYVPVHWYPRTIWSAYKRGNVYTSLHVLTEADIDPFEDRIVRIGSYGDPAAVPQQIWHDILGNARSVLGYTQRWRPTSLRNLDCTPDLQMLTMASVLSRTERLQAKALGFRTYRVLFDGDVPDDGEIICPYVTHEVQCEKCRLCDGKRDRHDRRKDIAIPVHGAASTRSAAERTAHLLRVVQ